MHANQRERDQALSGLADALLATDPHLKKLSAENPHVAYKEALRKASAMQRQTHRPPQMLTARDQRIADRDQRVSDRAEQLLQSDYQLSRLYNHDERKGYIAALTRASREIPR